MDFQQYYNLESYLLDTVRCRFMQEGRLSAADFFCIIIWKANRAKSKEARRLLARGYKSLEVAVRALTTGLAQQPDAKERLRYLWAEWEFRLPMASAILTILYPDEFTVYDVRVCDALGGFHNLGNLTDFEDLWRGYQAFKRKVEEAAPEELSLRDKDRYLWGKAFYGQLMGDIERWEREFAYDVVSIPEDAIRQQREAFDALLASLGHASPDEVQKALAGRQAVEPEPDLSPQVVARLRQRVAQKAQG